MRRISIVKPAMVRHQLIGAGRADGFGTGTADTSASVYGCMGGRQQVLVGEAGNDLQPSRE
jgi:hypothetical protein